MKRRAVRRLDAPLHGARASCGERSEGQSAKLSRSLRRGAPRLLALLLPALGSPAGWADIPKLQMPASVSAPIRSPVPAAASSDSTGPLSAREQKRAYAIGYEYGQRLRAQRNNIVSEVMRQGFDDVAQRRPLRYSDQERSRSTDLIAPPAGATPGANSGTVPSRGPTVTNRDQQIFSYNAGCTLAQWLLLIRDSLDVGSLLPAVQDGLDSRPGRLSAPEQEANLASVRADLEQFRLQQAARNGAESSEFLVMNGKRPGVVTTASGLQYEVIEKGLGAHPKRTDRVTINYTGRLVNGEIFDSDHATASPVTFTLDHVIAGMAEGILLMTLGARYRIVVPADLAYADRGAGSKIGPNQALIFDISLIAAQ